MVSSVCTLFEKDYHNGVATLANSLFRNGYRGKIWAGYKGSLPSWAQPLLSNADYQEFRFAEDCSIVFIPLNTERHLACFKPCFMEELLRSNIYDIDALFYFDPDIIVTRPWSIFEDWISWGIALCEDILSPIEAVNPQRHAWTSFFKQNGVSLNSKYDFYINSGFIGLRSSQIKFLSDWDSLLRLIAIQAGRMSELFVGQFGNAFWIPDQDALNAAVLSTEFPLSVRNKQAMGFENFGFHIMCHAIGSVKPWRGKKFLNSLSGPMPLIPGADSTFLRYCDEPIRLYTGQNLLLKRLDCKLSTMMYRFRRY